MEKPGREMMQLEGIMELVQYLDKNNPEALKKLEQELQETINRYREKYKVIDNKSFAIGGRTISWEE